MISLSLTCNMCAAKLFTHIVLSVTVFCLSACDILREAPFEVIAWTPGDEEIKDVNNINVSLLLSGVPNQLNVEKAFSITEDGNEVKGNFLWAENSFSFVPLSPFNKNKDYVVKLTTEADDVNGLSLEKNFEGYFTTRLISDHLFINSIDPQDESIIADVHRNIKIEFSDATTKASIENNISFSPSISGTWQLSDDGKTAMFYPKDKWKINETYIIKISSYLENIYAKQMGKDFESRITIVDEKECPQLIETNIVNTDNTIKYSLQPISLTDNYINETIYENENIERSDKIKLTFSKPIDVLKIKTYFQIEPVLKYKIETEPPYSENILIAFEDIPLWNNSYVLKLNPGLNDQKGNVTLTSNQYRIRTNGIHSKPPKLVGLKVPQSLVTVDKQTVFRYEEPYSTLFINRTNFPDDKRINLSFELYFETALDSEIDLFSAMELLAIESTNNSISFYVESIAYKTDNLESEFDNLKCLLVSGKLENTPYSGIFTIKIKGGLSDTNGNKNTEAMSIQLTK